MTNEKLTIQINDIQREMTVEEIAKLEETRSFHALELQIAESQLAAKATAKALAAIKLEALGLTTDDLKALGLLDQSESAIQA